MTKAVTFQDVIMRLERFWADHGCTIWQPYNEKVGAGTMNPATFLRVLGPEPWNVGYVEPSIRPDDGRYGENPNRMQLHHQYQVILKPDPGNPLELYLDSLAALGIDRDRHDIRFVEDNWESPALGAWGLGWEVWLDGLEITQFTYFQQAGGIILDPVAVEITYGLERIAMFLQGVRQVWDLDWDGRRTYGDLLLQPEIENCKYEFEFADVKRLATMYDLYEAEAKNCLSHALVLPAHDYVLKCSHTFNLLDSRGAIGVTERASYFRRMRDLSRQVAAAYLEQRTRMEYPWLPDGATEQSVKARAPVVETTSASSRPPLALANADFVLEIGVEELPSSDIASAQSQLEAGIEQWLTETRLDHGPVHIYATPRRLAVLIERLAGWQRDEEKLVKGPPARVAFDAAGQPTKAAEGFARSQGIPVESLAVREMDGGQYAAGLKRIAGRPAVDVLAENLPIWIAALTFGKTMRWNQSGVAFSRPIRWLVALHGDRVIPFTYAGVTSGRVTRGPRPAGSPDIELARAGEYLEALRQYSIILDAGERQADIADQIAEQAEAVGGKVPKDTDLLLEVTNLVEVPTAFRGDFEPAYLDLPREVLITVMKKHQRYFPLLRHERLMPHFIAVRNGGSKFITVVQHGNEAVLRARYADASYFWKADTSKPLESYLPRLGTLTFQEQLGSMLAKSQRLEKLAPMIGRWLHLPEDEQAIARRAAYLSKADLATQMVVELTSLQGVMGRYYAALSGESEPVALAIGEQYLPRFAGDKLPQTHPGAALALADKLDSLVGLFAVGLIPTGSADPYALRRTALGVNLVLIEHAGGRHGENFSLRQAVAAAASLLPVSASAESQTAVLDFLASRLRGILLDAGFRYDAVDAVLAEQADNPAAAKCAVIELADWVKRPDWPDILANYSRCVRITRDLKETYSVNPEGIADPTGAQLWNALQAVTLRPGARSVDEFFTAFTPLVPYIKNFFDRVLVMAEDPDVRRNRLGLVQRIAALAKGIVDLSKMEGF